MWTVRVLLVLLTLHFSLLTSTAQTDNDTMVVDYHIVPVPAQMEPRTLPADLRKTKTLVKSSLDALNGQVAGVQVTNSGNQEAMVSAVRVRGTTSLTGSSDPLVIIDGVTADLAALATIYPADIQSIGIWKDASETAQYGSRGAAGVIEVTTRKGRAQQFHISYDGTMGVECINKRLSMLNASQFRQASQALGLDYIDLGYDTNFGKSIERTGLVQNHHIAFGGGTSDANYRASIGVMDYKTVIRNNGHQNYTAKLDIWQQAFDERLKVALGVFGSLQKYERPPFRQKLLFSAQTFNPTFPDGTNADGSYNQVTEALWISNPNSLLAMQQDEENAHITAHLKATLDLGKRWMLQGFASYSFNTVNNAHYYPTFVWNHGEAYRANDKTKDILGHLTLSRDFMFGASELSFKLMAEAQQQYLTGFCTQVTDFPTNAFGYDELSAGATRPWGGTDSYYSDSHMESFLVHARYALLDRYSLTVNARADASSKFGRNHRWGYFPSVSAAWDFSKEEWVQEHTSIGGGKLRIGYGLSGSMGGIGSYNSMQLMQPNGTVPMDGTVVTTLGFVRNANPDLKWEVKRTSNVGVDLLLWQNRIAVSLDFYHSKTSDMLYVYDVPVPPFTYDKLLANLGTMSSGGLEIGFGITPLRTRDMELAVNMNWTFERNKLVSLDGYYGDQYLTAPQMKGIAALWGPGFHGASDVVFQMVGQPLGVFYLPHCKGLATDVDGRRYYDVTDEKYICGQATPKAMMGSNIAFRYRQWDVTMQANGAFGHKIYNGSALTYMNMLSLPNYNVMDGAPEQNIQDQTISDYWLERGDYVNIDYLTIGWTVPVKAKYVQSLRLSASVNNLATITGYSGLTPIINSSVVNATLGIDDKNTLPVYRSYAIGISAKF